MTEWKRNGLRAEAQMYADAGARYALKKNGVKAHSGRPRYINPRRNQARSQPYDPCSCENCGAMFENRRALRVHSEQSGCARYQAKKQERATRRATKKALKPIKHQDLYDKLLGKPVKGSLAWAMRTAP